MGQIFLRFRLIFVVLMAAVLAGCAATSTVQQSKVLAKDLQPLTQLRLVYRNVELTPVSGKSSGMIDLKDADFDKLGEVVVAQAKPLFAQRQVQVTSATAIDGKTPIPWERGADGSVPYVLVLNPKAAHLSTTNKAVVTSTKYSFSAVVLDPKGGRQVWQATVEVSKRAPKDALTKAMIGNAFDAEYAQILLGTVIDRMKQDGVIN